MSRLWLLSVLFLLFSCVRAEKTPSEPAVNSREITAYLDQGDPELERIRLEAQAEFAAFARRLQSPGLGEGNFRVKCAFPADQGSGFGFEQLWLGNISFKNGRYYGEAANRPYYIRGLNLGDRLAFTEDDITDWMYEQDGLIIGGRSIKLLIERIPELDRDAALNEFYRRFAPEPIEEL
jgi:uncharacterized protein YegJ (DUF2314 family)